MPRFDADPTKVSASIEVHPAGDYECIVESVKPFVKMNEDGTPKNWGVRYTQRIAEGPLAGKPVIVSLYEHSENAKPLNKRYVMAAAGYPAGRDHESRFNSDYADKSWFIDTDENVVGDGWHIPVGKRIITTLGVKMHNGAEVQEFAGHRPVGS